MIEKLNSWSQEKADRFHNHLLRESYQGRYIWEFDNNGTFFYRDITVTYLRNDGSVFRLSRWYDCKDWKMHLALFHETTRYNIRIDIPIKHEVLVINDVEWHYSILSRPNKQLGIDIYQEIGLGNINNDYFMLYINQSAELMKIIKNISYKKSAGCPEVGLFPSSRFRDSVGHFWINFKCWNISFENFLDKTLKDFSFFCNNLNKDIPNCDLDFKKIVKYSEEQWNTLR